MLSIFFDTDQSHSTPRCAEIQPTSQQAAAATLNMSGPGSDLDYLGHYKKTLID